ncbi:MAG: rRNA maturation RNase YbeY [Candidatus Kapabacteria bacterium]|nr:rRNA maturation RNase YbeY [Candidatus Kapabacteria bacterium]
MIKIYTLKVFNSSSIKFLPIRSLISKVENLLNDFKVKEAVITFIYMDNDDIQGLNNQFLEHNYPTDVITFSLEDNRIDGEVYIGAEIAEKQAQEYKVTIKNECIRLAIHGTLHLLGYEDDTEEKRSEMHQLENKYIK